MSKNIERKIKWANFQREVNRREEYKRRFREATGERMPMLDDRLAWTRFAVRYGVADPETSTPDLIYASIMARAERETPQQEQVEVNELPPPALTRAEQLTLQALATFDPPDLASIDRVYKAMDPANRISERTIGKAIAKLVEVGLAERPEGARQGARCTLRGRRLVPMIAD